jgi:hypothetical protein
MTADIPDGPDRRICPEYVALVQEITARLRAVMPA